MERHKKRQKGWQGREGGKKGRGEEVKMYASLLFFGRKRQERQLMHQPVTTATHIWERVSGVGWLEALV